MSKFDIDPYSNPVDPEKSGRKRKVIAPYLTSLKMCQNFKLN